MKCRNCGAALNGFIITTIPQIHGVVCPSCGWRHEEQEKIIRSVYQEHKQQTNYDRIISMTPEELADFIGTHDCLDCPLNNPDAWCSRKDDESCKDGVLRWLKQEVTE